MKKILGLVSATLMLTVLAGCAAVGFVKEDIAFEYGSNISYSLKDYVEVDDAKELAKLQEKYDQLLHEEIDKIVEEHIPEGEEFVPVGEYEIVLSHSEKEVELSFSIVDTTAPVIKVERKLEAFVGEEVNYKDAIEVVELSNYEISVDDEDINYKEAGTYTAVVNVVDQYGNAASTEVEVEIKAATLKVEDTKVKVEAGSTAKIEVEVQGKDKKAKFTSSDEAVVKVDAKGNLTGVKAGTATVTVKANGIEKKSEVTVTKKAVAKVANTTPISTSNSSANSSGAKKSETKVTTTNTKTKVSTPTPSGTYNVALAKEAFAIQNQMRVDAGLKPLAWNDSLYYNAKTRAYEISVSFSHTRPNGSSWGTAYPTSSYSIVGENLAVRQVSASIVMKAWNNSPTHRANIMNSRFTSGAIVCYQENGVNHWAVIFAG